MMLRIAEMIGTVIGSDAVAGVPTEAGMMMLMVVGVVMVRSGLRSGHVGLIAVIRNSEAVA